MASPTSLLRPRAFSLDTGTAVVNNSGAISTRIVPGSLPKRSVRFADIVGESAPSLLERDGVGGILQKSDVSRDLGTNDQTPSDDVPGSSDITIPWVEYVLASRQIGRARERSKAGSKASDNRYAIEDGGMGKVEIRSGDSNTTLFSESEVNEERTETKNEPNEKRNHSVVIKEWNKPGTRARVAQLVESTLSASSLIESLIDHTHLLGHFPHLSQSAELPLLHVLLRSFCLMHLRPVPISLRTASLVLNDPRPRCSADVSLFESVSAVESAILKFSIKLAAHVARWRIQTKSDIANVPSALPVFGGPASTQAPHLFLLPTTAPSLFPSLPLLFLPCPPPPHSSPPRALWPLQPTSSTWPPTPLPASFTPFLATPAAALLLDSLVGFSQPVVHLDLPALIGGHIAAWFSGMSSLPVRGQGCSGSVVARAATLMSPPVKHQKPDAESPTLLALAPPTTLSAVPSQCRPSHLAWAGEWVNSSNDQDEKGGSAQTGSTAQDSETSIRLPQVPPEARKYASAALDLLQEAMADLTNSSILLLTRTLHLTESEDLLGHAMDVHRSSTEEEKWMLVDIEDEVQELVNTLGMDGIVELRRAKSDGLADAIHIAPTTTTPGCFLALLSRSSICASLEQPLEPSPSSATPASSRPRRKRDTHLSDSINFEPLSSTSDTKPRPVGSSKQRPARSPSPRRRRRAPSVGQSSAPSSGLTISLSSQVDLEVSGRGLSLPDNVGKVPDGGVEEARGRSVGANKEVKVDVPSSKPQRVALILYSDVNIREMLEMWIGEAATASLSRTLRYMGASQSSTKRVTDAISRRSKSEQQQPQKGATPVSNSEISDPPDGCRKTPDIGEQSTAPVSDSNKRLPGVSQITIRGASGHEDSFSIPPVVCSLSESAADAPADDIQGPQADTDTATGPISDPTTRRGSIQADSALPTQGRRGSASRTSQVEHKTGDDGPYTAEKILAALQARHSDAQSIAVSEAFGTVASLDGASSYNSLRSGPDITERPEWNEMLTWMGQNVTVDMETKGSNGNMNGIAKRRKSDPVATASIPQDNSLFRLIEQESSRGNHYPTAGVIPTRIISFNLHPIIENSSPTTNEAKTPLILKAAHDRHRQPLQSAMKSGRQRSMSSTGSTIPPIALKLTGGGAPGICFESRGTSSFKSSTCSLPEAVRAHDQHVEAAEAGTSHPSRSIFFQPEEHDAERAELQHVLPAFSGLVLARMAPRLFVASEVIFRENDPGSTVFLLRRGQVQVGSGDGTKVYAVLTEGTFFGELAILFGGTRTATCRAIGNCSGMWRGREWRK
ncbi:hypothetical protein M427DRAFT_145496 [Gonapodya prolifera JEL478]|uniref:Cyclic nucleotide-binding domain-containing protein n=1 Tax=Gonapodya prolifera (strain JEL478) TaxID=1344416 RepID=A0A139AG86_GONPJ|nr:hypothetical protein M427DRAFT_145496 [Gonapodya prolifera JEL478]|eukprot:KXS15574.1 hypothetical protein M427DRAFT_145496 [Gonapodya prolifera JEL478]